MSSIAQESRVEELLLAIQGRLDAMDARIRALEKPPQAPAPLKTAVTAAPAPAESPKTDEITEEILMVISAAVAAFMGVKARIRRVRRMSESGLNPWSQQGRVSIQASHNVHWTR